MSSVCPHGLPMYCNVAADNELGCADSLKCLEKLSEDLQREKKRADAEVQQRNDQWEKRKKAEARVFELERMLSVSVPLVPLTVTPAKEDAPDPDPYPTHAPNYGSDP